MNKLKKILNKIILKKNKTNSLKEFIKKDEYREE